VIDAPGEGGQQLEHAAAEYRGDHRQKHQLADEAVACDVANSSDEFFYEASGRLTGDVAYFDNGQCANNGAVGQRVDGESCGDP
jgi:allantoicase